MTTEIAGCIIQDGYQRVLLLHDVVQDWWDIPGGMAEPTESLRGVARREIHRVLGIAVRFTGLSVNLEYKHQGEEYQHSLFGAINRTGLLIPEPTETGQYDLSRFCNLGEFTIGRIGLSPAAELLSRKIKEGEVQLST